MIYGLALVFLSFSGLTIATLISDKKRRGLKERNLKAWSIDAANLLVQGLLIPVVQTYLLASLWGYLFPKYQGTVAIPGALSFLLSFALIDYLYYWNHRALHSEKLWRWHRLHHSAERLDFFVTSRNSLFTPVLIVYLWVNSLFVYLLGDASFFILASSLGAVLDLWRHSEFHVKPEGLAYKVLAPWLILPQDHSWHHSKELSGRNFGANLNLWDRLHNTFYRTTTSPKAWGELKSAELNFKEFFLPSKPSAPGESR